MEHKELFISCVDHVFEKWMGGQYKDDYTVMYAIGKLFYKKLPFEGGYGVWIASPAGEMSMQSTPSVRKYKSKTHKIQKLSERRKINIIFTSIQQKEECSYPICWGILKMSGSAFFT